MAFLPSIGVMAGLGRPALHWHHAAVLVELCPRKEMYWRQTARNLDLAGVFHTVDAVLRGSCFGIASSGDGKRRSKL
jgi:hypothetical protein